MKIKTVSICLFLAFVLNLSIYKFCYCQTPIKSNEYSIYFEPLRAYEITKQLCNSNASENSKKINNYFFLTEGENDSNLIFKFLEIGGFPLDKISKNSSSISIAQLRNYLFEISQSDSRASYYIKLVEFPHFITGNKTTTGFLAERKTPGYPESGDICFFFELKDGKPVVKEAKIVDNTFIDINGYRFLGDSGRITKISSGLSPLCEFYRIGRHTPKVSHGTFSFLLHDKIKGYSVRKDPQNNTACLSDELSLLLGSLGQEVYSNGKPIEKKDKDQWKESLSWFAKVINETEKKNALLYADHMIQEERNYPKYAAEYQRGKSIIASIPIRKITNQTNSNKDELRDDVDREMIKYVIEQTSERMKNEPKVKQWVDQRIDESVKRLKSSRNTQQSVAVIEKALEKYTENIVRFGHITNSLLKAYDIIEREKSSTKILELARKNDPCGAYKETLNTLAGDLTPGIGVIASPIISEILFEATADIYLDVGNRIAHWSYENGYAKNPPRWAKDRFSNGSGCFPPPRIEIGPPMVPAVPNGTPEPNKNVTPYPPAKVPQIVPAQPGPIPTPLNNKGNVASEVKPQAIKAQTVPFVPIITPIPLPPGPFSKKTP